jgi:hypothetical protein
VSSAFIMLAFTFLGLEVNKNMDWSSHTKKVEKEMSIRTGVLFRLENFLPKKTLLKVIPEFVCSPATYMLVGCIF